MVEVSTINWPLPGLEVLLGAALSDAVCDKLNRFDPRLCWSGLPIQRCSHGKICQNQRQFRNEGWLFLQNNCPGVSEVSAHFAREALAPLPWTPLRDVGIVSSHGRWRRCLPQSKGQTGLLATRKDLGSLSLESSPYCNALWADISLAHLCPLHGT